MPAAPPRALLTAAPRRWLDAALAAGPVVVVLLLLGIGGLLWLAWRTLDPTPLRRIVLATGADQGAYHEFGKRYVPLLRQHGVELVLRPTQGSADNLALLRDPRGDVQVAFVQGGVADAPSGMGDAGDAAGAAGLVSLGSVAWEPLWIFVREPQAPGPAAASASAASAEAPAASAAAPAASAAAAPASAGAARRTAAPSGPATPASAPPTSLAQLAGQRIHLGPVGSGTGPLVRRLAQANGLAEADLVVDDRALVHAVVELVQGRVDALAMVSAADAPLVQYLLRTPGVRLMDLAHSEAYARRFPFLRALVLPRGVVDLAADQPPQDLRLVGTTASLVAREALHPALVQLLVQTARRVHGEPGWFAQAGEFPNPTAAEFPLSAEAERVYRTGTPWLQRYLPFWVADFVDRMWFVLLPLLAVLLPLSRVLPPLVELRVRSRVFRWYANLRAIDRALEAPGADAAALAAELDEVEARVDRIGVPLAYAHELYALRHHIQLVRRRLAARGAGGAAAGPPGAAADIPADPSVAGPAGAVGGS